MSSGTPNVLSVPKILRNDVECFILHEFSDADGVAINVFPDVIPGIVFHFNHGRPAIESIITTSGSKSNPPTSFLYGPGTESSVMHFSRGSYSVMRVLLKPHALKSLFGINAQVVKGSALELNALSKEDINEQLLNAGDDQERITVLTRFLVGKLNQATRRDKLIEESLRLIHENVGAITVRSLVDYLDLSERQFERRFNQTVGISPLAYIRVRRFNEALRLMKTGQYNTLTEVAYALNFHDQSHFIREIKTFTGSTPKGLSQKVDDFYSSM